MRISGTQPKAPRAGIRLTAMVLGLLTIGSANVAQASYLQTGSYGNLNWTAQSTIVGQTSTGTIASGGSPTYLAPMPQYNGVVSLIMNYSNGSFICSGTLMSDRKSILTAAHCVAGASGTPLSTTAYFYGGSNPETIVNSSPLSSAVAVSNYYVNPFYTGSVIDQNDIAVLTLASEAPAFANSYGLYGGSDLTGNDFNVAGYGRRSDAGGNVGANLGTGRLRQGDNRYDFRLGDSDFFGIKPYTWSSILGEPTAQIAYTYLSDFDNGNPDNDLSCNIATYAFGIGPSAKYCNSGRGATEVSVAGGDSGGPQFIGGLVSSVTSFGLTFKSGWGDVDDNLNSSFGEFNGFVPVSIHTNFIHNAMNGYLSVPEPDSLALIGLGLFGVMFARRRKQT